MNKAEQLWQDYEFLTHEMDKFISCHQLELFAELTKQRQVVQDHIDAAVDGAVYRSTMQGQAKIKALAQLNDQIQTKLLQFRNQAVQQRNVSNAYEGLGQQGISGNFFNRST